METETVVRPRFWPRDFLDVAIGLSTSLLQVALIFFLPSLVLAVVSGRSWLGVAASASLYVLWLLFTVRRATVSDRGLRFVRVLGRPSFLAWSEIHSVQIASRRDVVLHGWLWPIFPAREMTACLSAKFHVRIDFVGGHAYYPAADPERFYELLRQRLAPVA